MTSKQDSPQSVIQSEAIQMTRVYELELKAKHSISPNLISELELDAAAADLLKQANKRGFSVKAGDLYPAQTEKVNRQGQHGQGNYIVEEPASEFWADEVVGIDELIQDTQGRELTASEEIQLKVMRRAKEALLKPRNRPPRYLSQCFDWYCANRPLGEDWPTAGVEYRKRNNRFLDIMAFIGDCTTEDPSAPDRIQQGLQDYALDKKETTTLKGQTVKRYMKETVSAFREISATYNLKWKFTKPKIRESAPNAKATLSFEEQKQLVQWCLNTDDMFAAILLAQLHGGLMATELKRLSLDIDTSCILDGPIPYLLLKEKTKTKDRKRVVPLVLGVGVMQRNLKDGIRWLNQYTGPTHSTTLSEKLEEATGNNKLTAHCLRHTWNWNATVYSIDPSHRAQLCGWGSKSRDSDSTTNMAHYGREGIQQAPFMRALAESQRKVFTELLPITPTGKTTSNVVSINRRG